MNTLSATLMFYRLDTTKAVDKSIYDDLVKDLKDKGYHKSTSTAPRAYSSEFNGFWDKIESIGGKQVTIETDFLFSNQLNTAPIEDVSATGMRLFDWSEVIFENKAIKQGYYVTPLDELRRLRETTLQCGFCGHLYREREPVGEFCQKCLGSRHLKSSELRLLRLLPVTFKGSRPELTEEERTRLLPTYRQAQIDGITKQDKELRKKDRDNLDKQYRLRVKESIIEFIGMNWLLDRGIDPSNVIFYKHSGYFCIGWQNSLEKGLADEIEEMIKGFPFPMTLEVYGEGKRDLKPLEPAFFSELSIDPLKMIKALGDIHEILDAEGSWTPDTVEGVANVITGLGWHIRSPEEHEEEGDE